MAILVPVSMNKQSRTITKNKTQYTRIIGYVTINIGTDEVHMRSSENREGTSGIAV